MATVASSSALATFAEVSAQAVEGTISELLWLVCGFAIVRALLAFGVGPRMRMTFNWGFCPRFSILNTRKKPEARGTARQSAVKSMLANGNAGKHAAVLETWRREKTRVPLSVQGLQAVAHALAQEQPECLVDELTSYIAQHSSVYAQPATLNALLETLALKGGHVELSQKFSAAAKKLLGVNPDKATHEIFIGAYAAAGNQSKVEELNEALSVVHLKMTQRGHSMVIKGFVKSGKLDGAVCQVLQMVQQGVDVPPQAVCDVYRCACGKGAEALQHVLEQLGERVPLSAECTTLLLTYCAQHEDVDMAVRIEKLAGGSISHYGAYEPLLKLYAKVEGPRAIETFQAMQDAGFFATEGLCGNLLARCAETQNLSLAEAIAAYLRQRSMMTLAIYKTLMKVYACCGLLDQACDLYQQVRADGIEPDHVMYGCLVKFAVKCGRTELSQELFEKAQGGDVQNYMWLIRAAGSKGDVNKAFELLRKLESSEAVHVDIAVYNSVLDACVSNDQVDRARDLLKEMKAKKLMNLVTYNTLMKGHCVKGDVALARRVMRDMVEAGLTPDGASYNCILGAAVSAGNFSAAWEILDEMDSRAVARDHYTVSIMMKAARKAKNPKDAQRALSALDKEGLNVCEDDVLLNTVLDACVHRRDLPRLAKVLRCFEASQMKPSVHTYGLLIKAFSVAKKIWRCRELWTEMVEQRGVLPNCLTLSCMLDALISSGGVEEAVALFEEWKTKVPPNTVIYSTLIKGFASQGDPERAMQMYRRLRAEGLQMNLVAYTTLIDAQARVGNMAEATEMLKQMREDGCQPNVITYSSLVKGYCTQGNLEEAFRVFNDMVEGGLAADTVIFNTLLDGCVRHSRFELADQFLTDMGTYGIEASNFTVSIMIKMWGKRRRLDDAFATVSKFLKEKRLRLDPQVGTCLVSACIHNRNVDRALEAFEDIKTWRGCDGPDAATYGALITGLVRFGRCRKAVELVEEAHRLASGPRPSIQRVSPETMKLLFKSLHQYNLAEELGKPLAEKLGDPMAWKCAAGHDNKEHQPQNWRNEFNSRAGKPGGGVPRRT